MAAIRSLIYPMIHNPMCAPKANKADMITTLLTFKLLLLVACTDVVCNGDIVILLCVVSITEVIVGDEIL